MNGPSEKLQKAVELYRFYEKLYDLSRRMGLPPLVVIDYEPWCFPSVSKWGPAKKFSSWILN